MNVQYFARNSQTSRLFPYQSGLILELQIQLKNKYSVDYTTLIFHRNVNTHSNVPDNVNMF